MSLDYGTGLVNGIPISIFDFGKIFTESQIIPIFGSPVVFVVGAKNDGTFEISSLIIVLPVFEVELLKMSPIVSFPILRRFTVVDVRSFGVKMNREKSHNVLHSPILLSHDGCQMLRQFETRRELKRGLSILTNEILHCFLTLMVVLHQVNFIKFEL